MQMAFMTRAWLACVVVVALCVLLGWVPEDCLTFDLKLVLQGQTWRLVTSILYLGPLSMAWLMNIYMIACTSDAYERNSYPSVGGAGSGTLADTAWTLLLGAVGILLGSGCALGHAFPGKCLPMYICYLSCKRNTNVRFNIWGMPPGGIPAPSLPLALVAFTAIFRGDTTSQLLGIAVAHIYYNIAVELAGVQGPQAQLRLVLATPHAVCRLFGTAPTDRAPPGQRQTKGGPSQQHFPGTGRTLNGGVVHVGWWERAWVTVEGAGVAVGNAGVAAWRALWPPHVPAAVDIVEMRRKRVAAHEKC